MNVKVRKVKGDNGIKDLFNQMTGVTDADPAIISAKYEGMRDTINKFISAWQIFIQAPFVKEELSLEAGAAVEDIKKFVVEGQALLNRNLKIFNEKIQMSFTRPLQDELHDMANKYDSKELNAAYRELKSSTTLKCIMVTFSNLKTLLEEERVRQGAWLNCLDDPNNMSNAFIIKAVNSTKILNFSNMDFKFIYTFFAGKIESFNSLILTVLRISYVSANNLYKIINTPDIDVDKFVDAFSVKLEEIKKVIPDCNKAFDCLKKSLKLLKNKFGDYHQEFVKTDNPNIIFELFVEDIKKRNENNPTLMVQFKKIVGYIKQHMPKDIQNNPAVQKLYSVGESIFGNVPDKEGE